MYSVEVNGKDKGTIPERGIKKHIKYFNNSFPFSIVTILKNGYVVYTNSYNVKK